MSRLTLLRRAAVLLTFTPAGRRAALAAALLATLAACATPGPSPEAPRLFAAEPLLPASRPAAALPAAGWWRSFGDPQLDALIERALAEQPTLALAEARRRAAAAAVLAAGGERWPNLLLNADSQRQRFTEHGLVPPPLAGSWQTTSRVALDLGYEIDLWGRHRAQLEAANRRAEAADFDREAARLLVAAGVARAYFAFALAQDELQLAEREASRRAEVVRLLAARVGAGLAPAAELAGAEAGAANQEAQLAAARAQERSSRLQLAALAGMGPAQAESFTAPRLAAPPAGPGAAAAVPADLLARRPDLAAQRQRVEAAAAEVKVARAAFYPNVNLVAFVGLQSIDLAKLTDPGSTIAGAGPALHLPLFDGGRLQAGLDARHAAYAQAVADYNATLLEALRDAAEQLTLQEGAQTRLEQTRRALGHAEHARELVAARRSSGLASRLDQLAAEAGVIEQQRAIARQSADWRIARAGLARALGGGFVAPAALATAP